MKLETRSTQTRVKHKILSEYLSTWGGIITNGLIGRAKRTGASRYTPHFVYVDCFAFTGKYAGEQEDAVQGRPLQPVYGSPIIGIECLDKLAAYATGQYFRIRTNAILIEEKRSCSPSPTPNY